MAATVAAVWIGRRQRALGPVVAVLALVAFCALATVGQVALDRVVRSWDVTAAAITRHSAAVMHDELTALASDLRNNAANALDAPANPAGAFAWLAPLARGDGERSVVLSRDGHPVAWSGTLRTAPDTSGAPFAVVRTPFYVALQATVRRGTARAVAVALLHAEPPADRLSRPLDETIAERTGVDGFALMPPSAGAPPIGDDAPAAFEPAGVPLATVRPIPPQLEEAAERVTERAQANGALAFAVALVGFLIAEWRPRRSAPVRRLVALAVPLAALAIVPLNAFSNTSRLVDPTYFFSPVGGPYTASVGALGATSAIALLAAFAAARARARLRPRWLAAAIALVASIGAPFAVAYVAGGITPPGAAVPLTLWVGWQIALALGAAALLVGASVAARSALAERQGLPPIAPIIAAAAAAVLGPILWVAPAGWPLWYALPWCVAGAAAAFARGSRWRVFLSALVAALGSAVVVWGTTAQKRIVLAERDLAGLAVPDPNAVALLDRFGTELAAAPPPVSRADLLHCYARSDLAAADYPVRLAVRSGSGAPGVALELARFDIDTVLVAAIASEALATRAIVLTEAAGCTGRATRSRRAGERQCDDRRRGAADTADRGQRLCTAAWPRSRPRPVATVHDLASRGGPRAAHTGQRATRRSDGGRQRGHPRRRFDRGSSRRFRSCGAGGPVRGRARALDAFRERAARGLARADQRGARACACGGRAAAVRCARAARRPARRTGSARRQPAVGGQRRR